MSIIIRILHAKYDISRTQDMEVIKVSITMATRYVANAYCPKEALY